jgi:hypothetical protein
MSVELAAKQLAFLRELRPGAARIAVLVDPKFPTTERFLSKVRVAASAVGQQLIVLDVSSDREVETAFTTLVQRGAGALHVGVGMLSQRERIVRAGGPTQNSCDLCLARLRHCRRPDELRCQQSMHRSARIPFE